jgi:hypothetical protein
MTNILRLHLVFFALLFSGLLGNGARAQVINATSCSSAAVQTAFNSVGASTTTVNIPAGTCNWTSQITLIVPSGNKSLSILGAGSLATVGGSDQTLIVDNDTGDTNYLLMVVTGTSSSFLRIAGITFQSGAGTEKDNGFLFVGGNSQSVRIDHNHFQLTTGVGFHGDALRFGGWNYGVVDHNIFDGLSGGQNAVVTWMGPYGGGGNQSGDGSWNAPTSLGSSGFIFAENNVFNNILTSNDCVQGGRNVFRFNVLNGTALQTHPTGSQGDGRGCRAFEIYLNTFSGSNASPNYNAYFLSSGTGVVWGNVALSGYEIFMSIQSMRVSNSTYSQSGPPSGWGYCTTAQNGTGSPWDFSTTAGPCIDQPGRGKGDLLSGLFPTKCDATLGCNTNNGVWSNQALEPVYEWLNQWQGVPGYPYPLIQNSSPTVLAANQDYYAYTLAWNGSSFAGTAFNGTVGTGSGTLASRPTTCTKGTAYWATDQGNWNQSGNGGQGELFACSATNTWTLFYTPYTYPHPLTVGTVTPPPAGVQLTLGAVN